MKMVQIKGFEESHRNVSAGNHTRTHPPPTPQLLHKCDVTLTDKQIIRGEEGERMGRGYGGKEGAEMRIRRGAGAGLRSD